MDNSFNTKIFKEASTAPVFFSLGTPQAGFHYQNLIVGELTVFSGLFKKYKR